MKHLIIALTAVLITSCATSLNFTSFIPDSAPACKNPEFIITVAKKSSNEGMDLTLYELTKEAQKNMGNDVSIQNVHWDVIGGVKVSVIYDVIRCNGDSLKAK
jgi:hypothetical protein